MKKIVKIEDKTFICHVYPDGPHMGEVYVWERKRPKWPIFKDSYCDSMHFYTVDYTTIDAAVRAAVYKVLESRQDSRFLGYKWQQFEKTINEHIQL